MNSYLFFDLNSSLFVFSELLKFQNQVKMMNQVKKRNINFKYKSLFRDFFIYARQKKKYI